MTSLYLARHGESYLNTKGVYFGITDCELTKQGVTQCENLNNFNLIPPSSL